jgi:GNAT superfamily N-acetyltransferase
MQFFMGSAEHAVPILAACFGPEPALSATVDGRLVGLAALQVDGRHFFEPRLRVFVRRRGGLRGLWGWFWLRKFRLAVPADEVGIETLAVTAAVRGRGIGTQLLEATFDYGRRLGKRAARLDVVDTNSDARRLYERIGFVAVKTERFPFASRYVGFSATTIMVKPL